MPLGVVPLVPGEDVRDSIAITAGQDIGSVAVEGVWDLGVKRLDAGSGTKSKVVLSMGPRSIVITRNTPAGLGFTILVDGRIGELNGAAAILLRTPLE